MCNNCKNLNQFYKFHEVFPRFMHRHFLKKFGVTIYGIEIYDHFFNWCLRNHVQACSQNYLTRYLQRVNGLMYFMGTGNKRSWSGLQLRSEFIPQSVKLDPVDLEPWLADEDENGYEPLANGRPFHGYGIMAPPRPETTTYKGTQWRLLWKQYRNSNIIKRFSDQYLIFEPLFGSIETEAAASLMRGEYKPTRGNRFKIWHLFDKFCEQEGVATCSITILRKQLKVAAAPMDSDGYCDWLRVTINEPAAASLLKP